MIQFNLLPDVKLEYIKAQRTKRLFVTVSLLASAVTFTVFVLLFLTVNVAQKKNLSDLNGDIKVETTKLQQMPNLNRILTIQNQLSALDSLHAQKPAASKLIPYLGQLTPSNVTISNTTADFEAKTLTITGNGSSLDAVNTFVDTLKFTNFTTDKGGEASKAFSEVVLTAFTRTSNGTTYTIGMKYDPAIFDNTNTVNLSVPNTVTTRSVTEQPANLFNNASGGTR